MKDPERTRGRLWWLLLLLIALLPAAIVLYLYLSTADVAPFEYHVG